LNDLVIVRLDFTTKYALPTARVCRWAEKCNCDPFPTILGGKEEKGGRLESTAENQTALGKIRFDLNASHGAPHSEGIKIPVW
jgi:hypothetical protein